MKKFIQFYEGELIAANTELYGHVVGKVNDYRMRYNDMVYYVTLIKPTKSRLSSKPRYEIIIKQSEIITKEI